MPEGVVVVVDDVPEPVSAVDEVELDVVVVDPTVVVPVEPGIVVGGAVVVDVVEDFGLSGEVQPDGGTPLPVWPGIRMVPAHPKFEKVASKVTEPPSAKVSIALTWQMKPAPSMETMAVLAV